MRRLLLLSVLLLAFPTAARPAANDAATSLTLRAPGATTYGHQVDFVGRISPAAPGVHVRLLRGSTFVAGGYTNPDGSYRIQVDVARPGPFHAEASGIASPSVTVRIIPQLAVTIVGPRVAGSPLQLRATLTPNYAGAVRVRAPCEARKRVQERGVARLAVERCGGRAQDGIGDAHASGGGVWTAIRSC